MQPLIDFYKAKRRSLVYSASKRVGPDWAEDAVHDAFERAIKYYESYNPAISEFGTWFGPILNKVCNDVKSANRGYYVEIQEDDWTSIHVPEDSYFLDEMLSKLVEYPEQERQVLYCVVVLQYSYRHTSKITGLGRHVINDIKEAFVADMRERYGEDSSA